MALTPDDVVRLAGLARIDLTDDEIAYLAPQLDAILDAVAAVSGVPTDDVPPEAVTPPVKVQVLLITPEGEEPRWEVAYGTPGLVDAQYALCCGLVVVAAARLAAGLNAVGVGR